MKIIYALPLVLAACAAPFPQDQIVCDPATQTCICERPMVTLAAIDKRGDRATKAPERPEPEPEEPGGHWATRDNEPDSRVDPEGHRDWQRDRDRQIEEGTW